MKQCVLHYLVIESITHPAVISQAIGTAIELREQLGIPVTFWGLRRPRKQEALLADALTRQLEERGIKARFYVNWREKNWWHTILTMLGITLSLRRTLGWNQQIPILARNLFSATIAYLLAKITPHASYVIDLRGHSAAQLELAGVIRQGDMRWRLFHWWERILFENARAVLCVSSALADYVGSKCQKPVSCYVVPSCLDTWLINSAEPQGIGRLKSSLNGRFVVVYSGTVTAWNQPEPMIRLFLSIKTQQPSALFLFLTPHTEAARSYFHKYGVSENDFVLLEIPHADILHYLELGDVALLLREFNMVNRVASPVKFAEYLAAGLPVIITEGVGDCTTIVRQEHVGLVLKSPKEADWDGNALSEFLSDVAVHREEYKERARATAHRYFLRSQYMALYRQALFDEIQ